MIRTYGIHSLNSSLHSFLIEPAAPCPCCFIPALTTVNFNSPLTAICPLARSCHVLSGQRRGLGVKQTWVPQLCYLPQSCVILHRLFNLSDPISYPGKWDKALRSVKRIKFKKMHVPHLKGKSCSTVGTCESLHRTEWSNELSNRADHGSDLVLHLLAFSPRKDLLNMNFHLLVFRRWLISPAYLGAE